MADDENLVRVKKVSPYPFTLHLSKAEDAEINKGNVVKLTQVGFLAEFSGFLPIVGDSFVAEFYLPTYPMKFAVRVNVIKTYDSFRTVPVKADPESVKADLAKLEAEKSPDNGSDKANDYRVETLAGTIHLAEMHFKDQPAVQKKHIYEWLVKIKQV